VARTVHNGEGLNVMVYNGASGPRYCSNNCPYKAAPLHFFNFTKDTPDPPSTRDEPGRHSPREGRGWKSAAYCTQTDHGVKIDARLAGRELRDGRRKRPAAGLRRPLEFGRFFGTDRARSVEGEG